jgi:phospholipid/cholesterol/gamma-HCH transport system substrate-binding protein
METRARYVLIGLFTLAVIALGFGFVYWLNTTGGLREHVTYRVRFENSVPGLIVGSAVLFNGIRVGEVTNLHINPSMPRQVIATIAIDKTTPIRVDTEVNLEYQGLIGGSAAISLVGGSEASPTLNATPGAPPLLVADPTAGQSTTNLARGVLRRLDTILADNADALRSTIANLNTFAIALGRNSDRLDGIVAGVERMVGGPNAKPVPVYTLSAPTSLASPANPPRGQLAILEPTAVVMFDSQKILVRSTTGEVTPVDNAQWSDSLPKLIQAKIIQSFENANLGSAVGRPVDGFTANYQLLIDIRSFQISAGPNQGADIELSARILGDSGKIIDVRIFRASAPVKAIEAPSAVAALNEAFSKIALEIVSWASVLI